ncbi:MAG: hypothetical protein H6R15_377 [Proteobacteria bacterium]|nr:hypothetical protein [Pseudomonadota bacterium]
MKIENIISGGCELAPRKERMEFPGIAPSVGQGLARVIRNEDGLALVDAPGCKLKIAVSCLVEPQDGDLVLVVGSAGHYYVLAVLERDCEAGQVTIDLGRNRLHIKANELHFEAENTLGFVAMNLRVDCELSVQNTSTQVINVSGSSLLNASAVAVEARQSYSVHTQLGAIQASALLKVDGAQLHFG